MVLGPSLSADRPEQFRVHLRPVLDHVTCSPGWLSVGVSAPPPALFRVTRWGRRGITSRNVLVAPP